MAFGLKSKPAPITLNGLNLPWWDECWPHLGHLLNKDQSPHYDLMKKKAEFIGKIHSFRQEFGGLDPIVFTKLVSIYLTSFYGSNLWDLYDKTSESLFKCWNIMVRMNWDIPRNTHKYLIEPISQNCHLKINLVKRSHSLKAWQIVTNLISSICTISSKMISGQFLAETVKTFVLRLELIQSLKLQFLI